MTDPLPDLRARDFRGRGVFHQIEERDGAVAALYRVGGCPTFAYVYPGGTLEGASIGELGVGGLSHHVEELLIATKVAERG